MAVVAVAAGGAASLAGCAAPPAAPSAARPAHAAAWPGAQRSPSQTVAEMRKAVQAAGSVHLSGVLRNNGKPIGLNLGLIRSGEFAGTLTQNGIPLNLIDVGGKVYVKATAAYLRELKVPPAVCSIMCGKYVEVSSAQARSLSGSLSMSALLSSFTGRLPQLTNAGTTTVAGHRGQVLQGPDGSRLIVAATGTPYPLQAVGREGNGGRPSNGTLDFSRWNAVPRPKAPPASQVINLNKIRS
ncbi:MAG TPA: hypothetical protein VMC03_07735 [Streptosporangiaceae bacterium]|nr:hypothetical protein [Streptosporangiaceae bacterium]